MTNALPESLAGAELGIEPIDPTLHTRVIPPIRSKDIVSTEDYRDGSEYGGVGGRIQPPPHVPTASERLAMVYAIDPTDDGTRPDSIAPPELDGLFSPR
jgi:hypothetical protein